MASFIVVDGNRLMYLNPSKYKLMGDGPGYESLIKLKGEVAMDD